MKFEKLFEAIKIGKVTVNNRIVMGPMVVNFAGPGNETTDQLISYYEARAQGGVGLLIVEASHIKLQGKVMLRGLGIDEDQLIPGLSRLADAIKRHGTTAAIQIIHGGIQAKVLEPVGPSPIGRKSVPPAKTPRELTTEEVEQLVEDFAMAALRAKKAGFDMVQIHGTHGYLVCQFLSPLTNKRTDKYGVDRVLFAEEIVRHIKEKCGDDFPVIFRLCADEFLEGGINIDYAKKIAKKLEEVGVDAFDITGGNYDTMDLLLMPMYYENEGFFFKLASEIKGVVNVPVMSGGLIKNPEVAEKALKDGIVDMVFLGRQLIADPEWPRKIKEGKVEDIRPCLACNEGCIGRLFGDRAISCAVNPLNGLEYKWLSEEDIPKTKNKKKVLVIGGGPAGLESARILAIKGHDVTLVEKEGKLGGTVNIAAVPSFKSRLGKLIKWYEAQLKQLGKKVMTDTIATPKLIKKLNPDVVIVATGSEPLMPDIPGIENAVTADDILLGKVTTGENIIVIGGGLVGCDTALYLAQQGKKVTIIEAQSEIARDLELISKIALIKKGGLLEKYGINVITNTSVTEIGKGEVVIKDKTGEQRNIRADSVVIAVGRKPLISEELISEAKKISQEVYVIGDAKGPRKVIDAIHEGFSVAIDIK